MATEYYSASQAAKLGGVSLRTLQRWVREGKIKPPKTTNVGGIRARWWSDAHIDRIRAQRRRGRPL